MLEPRAAKIRAELVKVATKRQTVHYQEVADLVGLSLENYNEREIVLPKLLGDISRSEHEHDRPLLSVVVVLKADDQQPGRGFFVLARELDKRFDDDFEFFTEELKAVWDYWHSHKDGE